MLYAIELTNDGAALARIDPATGGIEDVRVTGIIPYDVVPGPDRTLYAEQPSADGGSHLVTYDVDTGIPLNDVVTGLVELAGVEAATGQIVAVTQSNGSTTKIVRIDPASGESTELAPIDPETAAVITGPFAFDGAHRLAGVDWRFGDDGSAHGPADLLVIDTATGAVRRIATGQPEIQHPAFDPRSGFVYAVSVGEPSTIVSIDPATGGVRAIGELAMDYVSAAAFDVRHGRYVVVGGWSGTVDHRMGGPDSIVGVDVESGDVVDAPRLDTNDAVAFTAFVN